MSEDWRKKLSLILQKVKKKWKISNKFKKKTCAQWKNWKLNNEVQIKKKKMKIIEKNTATKKTKKHTRMSIIKKGHKRIII